MEFPRGRGMAGATFRMPHLLIANAVASNLRLQCFPDERRAGRSLGPAHRIDELQQAVVDGHLNGFL